MLFERSPNPVLLAQQDLPWASGAVFNPGAWFDGEKIHLLFRAIPQGYRRYEIADGDPVRGPVGFDNYVSYIGYATSTDGLRFTVAREPFLVPDSPEDRFGVEDPRISCIDDTYLITYTALASPAFGDDPIVRIALATTRDFSRVHKRGIVGPDVTDKDAVLFPRSFDGRIAMLHRIAPDIQIIFFDDFEQLYAPPTSLWKRHIEDLDTHVILRPTEPWEAKKIGAGPTPIETKEGWLLIYHGVDHDHVYRMGMALLDFDDPRRIIARTRRPVLEPSRDYECDGDVPNVVFPEGAVVIDGRLHVYYGAADRVIGHASAALSDVLDALREETIVV
jgi:beta-1,2-mannobiose phosphorylase / 1,2-beta-oligomannan phosphorylase